MQHWQCALLLSGCFVGLLWLWLRYARISEQSSRALLQISETSHRQPERNRMLPVLVYSVCCLVATLVSAASPISMIADNGLVLLMAAALSEGFVLPALAAFAAFALMVSPFEGVCLAVPVIWSAYQSFTAKACLSVNLSEGDVEHVATAGGRARLPLSANQDGKTVSEPPRHSFGATVLKSICYGVLCVAFALVSEVGRSDRVWQGRFPTHFPALSAGLREVYSFAAAVLAPLRQGRVFEAVIAALLHMRPASVDAASLQPELSLMWYVGSAAFSRHLPYYAAIFAGHALLYPLPATFRLRRRPDLAIVLVAGLAALLNPTSRWSLARMPLVVCLALSHSAVIARMTRGSPHVWLGVLCAAVIAAPALKHAWLVALTSNANVLFNMALAVTVAGGSLLAEFASASLRAQKVQARLQAWSAAGSIMVAGATQERSADGKYADPAHVSEEAH